MEVMTRDVPTTAISGFHQDAAGDWVAELACGHTQHMRHRPPWQNRPWVMTEAGRAAKVGAPIACPQCGTHRSPADPSP
jgi:hypothetical protein